MRVDIARGDQLERRMAVFAAGGPVTSLVLGLALGALSLLLAGSPFKGLAFFLLFAANFTLIVGLLVLIPYRTGGYLSDGARLLRLWLNGPAAARDAALWAIISLVNAETRPREVPQTLLDRALEPKDNGPERLLAEALAAMVESDRGDRAAALKRMQGVMARGDMIPPLMRPNYCLDAAYMEARYGGEAARAAAYLEQTAGGIGLQAWHRARAASAVALASGEYDRALTLAREGLQALEGQPVTGLVLAERDMLEDLEAWAQSGDAH